MSEENHIPDPEIIVVERARPKYQWERRGFQEMFECLLGPGYARWLADPKSGRFLIIDALGDSPESTVWNVDTERELVEVMAGKIVLQIKRKNAGLRIDLPHIHIVVSPSVQMKLERMRDEINGILEGKL